MAGLKSLVLLWASLALVWEVSTVEVVELFDDGNDAEAKLLTGELKLPGRCRSSR